MKNKIIQEIEQEQLRTDIPSFAPGDTVVVEVRVKEGDKERLQAYQGVVIAKRNRGINSSFTVRKIFAGEGIERVFQTHSPMIASVKVVRRGDVRRAKLYYLRDVSARSLSPSRTLLSNSAADSPLLLQEPASGGLLYFKGLTVWANIPIPQSGLRAFKKHRRHHTAWRVNQAE